MYGRRLIQIHGDRPWDSKELMQLLGDIVDKGGGNEVCDLVIYRTTKEQSNHKKIDITISELFRKLNEREPL